MGLLPIIIIAVEGVTDTSLVGCGGSENTKIQSPRPDRQIFVSNTKNVLEARKS